MLFGSNHNTCLAPDVGDSAEEPASKRLKSEENDDDDDEGFGPQLPSMNDILQRAASDENKQEDLFDPSALPTTTGPSTSDEKTETSSTTVAREEWMLKLPEGRRHTLDYSTKSIVSFSVHFIYKAFYYAPRYHAEVSYVF